MTNKMKRENICVGGYLFICFWIRKIGANGQNGHGIKSWNQWAANQDDLRRRISSRCRKIFWDVCGVSGYLSMIFVGWTRRFAIRFIDQSYWVCSRQGGFTGMTS
jgi:hypothetical protein